MAVLAHLKSQTLERLHLIGHHARMIRPQACGLTATCQIAGKGMKQVLRWLIRAYSKH
jgi:hypothetical protein